MQQTKINQQQHTCYHAAKDAGEEKRLQKFHYGCLTPAHGLARQRKRTQQRTNECFEVIVSRFFHIAVTHSISGGRGGTHSIRAELASAEMVD